MKKIYNTVIKVGADPEGFFLDKDNVPLPVIGLLGGEKDDPVQCDGGGFLEDGVAFELNPEPAESEEEFVENISKCLSSVKERASELEATIKITSALEFPEERLTHPRAAYSGCLPDYDAWKMRENQAIILDKTRWRFASGNIHIDVPDIENHPERMLDVVKRMDLLMVPAEVLLTEDNPRRNYYGTLGSFRPTEYGIEWRTGGNWWLKDERYMRYAYRAAVRSVTHIPLIGEDSYERLWKAYDEWDKDECYNILCELVNPATMKLIAQ